MENKTAVNSAKISTDKTDGHRRRLRERFMKSGLAGFHDHEVIELLLTLATPRKDCKSAAKDALEKFGSLQDVLEASANALCEINGIGEKNVFGLKLIRETAELYLEKKLIDKSGIHNSKELFDYLYYRLRDKGREVFLTIFLNAKNKVLASEILFEGTVTESLVYPREVINAALHHHAAAIICAHNHPSGDPKPSPEDMNITRQLLFACRLMGIIMHEHIIIGDNQYYSFADQGHIKTMIREYAQLGFTATE